MIFLISHIISINLEIPHKVNTLISEEESKKTQYNYHERMTMYLY